MLGPGKETQAVIRVKEMRPFQGLVKLHSPSVPLELWVHTLYQSSILLILTHLLGMSFLTSQEFTQGESYTDFILYPQCLGGFKFLWASLTLE